MWLARSLLLLTVLSCKPVEQGPPIPVRDDAPQGGTVAMGGKATGSAPKGLPDFQKAISVTFAWDGSRTAAVANIHLEPGFHAYGKGEETGKPLGMEIAPGSWTVKEVVVPPGVEKDLGVLGKSVVVTGDVTVAALLTPGADPKAPASGVLRYQVCTDKSCDRPRSLPFQLTPP